MANYPQRKKKPEPETLGDADDGSSYVAKQNEARAKALNEASHATEHKADVAREKRKQERLMLRKGGKVKKYAEGGEAKSSRTKMLEEQPKNFMQEMATKVSKGLDKIGITQEKEYKGKTKEEVAVKKAKGGSIDGCAIRGKTRASHK